MRRPDFAALRHALEAGDERIDIGVLLNAMAWCCRAHEFPEGNVLWFMAHLIERAGPRVRLHQEVRNLLIKSRLRSVDRFHTTLSAERQSVADDVALSADRVAKIQRREHAASPLVDFVRAVQCEQQPEDCALVAAKQALERIHRRLLARGGKAEELRAGIVTGFGRIGKSSLAEEHYAEVEARLAEGMAPSDAIVEVARAADEKVNAVKSQYYRLRAESVLAIDEAVAAANAGNLVRDDATGAVTAVRSAISRQEMEARCHLGLDGVRGQDWPDGPTPKGAELASADTSFTFPP